MKKTVQILRRARRRIGVPQLRRTELVRRVAADMGVPVPERKHEQYALLSNWLGAVKSKPWVPRVVAAVVPAVATDAFLSTYQWRRLRMEVIRKRGARCECCGASPADGVRINVDHIKPRRKHPELALVESNLQVLCEDCNHGKGNWDQTDWRTA